MTAARSSYARQMPIFYTSFILIEFSNQSLEISKLCMKRKKIDFLKSAYLARSGHCLRGITALRPKFENKWGKVPVFHSNIKKTSLNIMDLAKMMYINPKAYKCHPKKVVQRAKRRQRLF